MNKQYWQSIYVITNEVRQEFVKKKVYGESKEEVEAKSKEYVDSITIEGEIFYGGIVNQIELEEEHKLYESEKYID